MTDMHEYVKSICLGAREASRSLALLSGKERNAALEAIAAALDAESAAILEENAADLAAGRESGLSAAMLDRLALTPERIGGICSALRETVMLGDPLGSGERITRPNGLEITRVRVPLGVVAIIYESRPNVTVDAAALCLKSGNAVVLRGGKEAIRTNRILVRIMRDALDGLGIDANAVCLIDDTSRRGTTELMGMRGLVDVLIPRGGKGLIRSVVENASVPVIETGAGNCHIYVHESADFDKALNIIVNAKTQRVGVCNAAESLLVDRAVADSFLPAVVAVLHDHGVLIHGDEATCAACADAGLAEGDNYVAATEEDWGREYLALEMSVKVVASEDEAIAHINRYGTMHSEAIVAEDTDACERFLDAVDASAVYANASTRFTDGGEFGLGAEIGISTQKLHARGPFAAEALTTYKYKLRGTGQVRP